MDRIKLIRECLFLTCFLEGIEANEKDRIIRLVEWLNSFELEELQKYYETNSRLKEIRLNRLIGYLYS